jgi:hypothetical protein
MLFDFMGFRLPQYAINHSFHFNEMSSLPVDFVAGFAKRIFIAKHFGLWRDPIYNALFGNAPQQVIATKTP